MDSAMKGEKGNSLSAELLSFYDDFSEFNEDCAFLCDAFSSLMEKSEGNSQASVSGFVNHADRVKSRVEGFKERLGLIRGVG